MPPSKRNKGEDPIPALRTITSLLTSDVSLSAHIPTIISLLYSSTVLESCNTLSNASGTNAQKRKSTGTGEDAGVLLHKYKTKVSSLLQSKTPQARWSGVALVKASVESSFECLASHGGVWVRLLVPLLARPEPPATHRLVIATLTRIFTELTTNKPTLIREIVVPNLPATIGHLLNFCSISDPSFLISEVEILATVLESIRDILQSHPVTFRPFAQKTHTLILLVLSSPSSTSEEEERLAREIFALLHLCASGSSRSTLTNADSNSNPTGNKTAAVADEWTRSFKAVIQDSHSTLNLLFRSVLEDNDYSRSGNPNGKTSGGETMEATCSSALGLADWKGIMEGVERVEMLLRLLQSFFTLPSAAQVSIPIGSLIDLTTRIFGVTSSTAHINSAVERSERELLFARLPELHVSVLGLISTVMKRLGRLFSPFAFLFVDQIAYVFGEGSWNAGVRIAVYCLLNSLLDSFGTGLAKTIVHSMHPILTTACDDLLPPPLPPTPTNISTTKSGKQKKKGNTSANQNFHADTFLSVLPTGKFTPPGLLEAAGALLATALAKLPTAHIRSELRTKMDRTAVLTNNTEAMLASVLFPPVGARRGGSILPHLVGASSDRGLVVEGVVRPRLPIVWTGKMRAGDDDDDDEMEDAEDEEEDEEEEESENEGENEGENEVEEVEILGSSKNPYTEETLAGESPYKRQKTAQMNVFGKQVDSASGHDGTKPKTSLLEEPPRHAHEHARTNPSTEPAATEPIPDAQALPISDIAAASYTITSTSAVSNTTLAKPVISKQERVEVTKTTTVSGEDSDDMEIPQIIMGESSSEDEDEDEE